MAAANDLEAHRRELHAFRKATFESYVAQNPPPPNYAFLAREPISAPSTSAPAFPVPQSQIGEETISSRDGDNIPTSGSTVQSQVGPSWLQMPEAGQVSPSWGTSASF